MTESGDISPAGTGQAGNVINSGMTISGGTFLGPVAGGYGAHATQVNQAAGDVLERLEHLLGLLEAGASSLERGQADYVIDDVVSLRAEMGHARPDPGRVRRLLRRLAAQVAPVAALLDVVNQVKDLVTPLLH
jgi:hypothetical protein